MRDTEKKNQKHDEEQNSDAKQKFSFINGLSIEEDYENLDTREVFQEF